MSRMKYNKEILMIKMMSLLQLKKNLIKLKNKLLKLLIKLKLKKKKKNRKALKIQSLIWRKKKKIVCT